MKYTVLYIVGSLVIVGLLAWGGWYVFAVHTIVLPINTEANHYLQEQSITNEAIATTTVSDNSTSTRTTTPVITNATSTKNTLTSKQTKHMITLDTNYGTIVIDTYDSDAPKTVANFVTLANKGFYNGLMFHRVIPGFMIQGGDPSGNGTGGPGYQFADELNPDTASFKAGYKKGVVAMANAGPNTNGSQFFIMAADYPLPNSYTIFGHVVSGQNVVDEIEKVKTGAGDKPLTPVIMKKVIVK